MAGTQFPGGLVGSPYAYNLYEPELNVNIKRAMPEADHGSLSRPISSDIA